MNYIGTNVHTSVESIFLMQMSTFTPLLKVQKPFSFSEVTHTYLDTATLKLKDKSQPLLMCSIQAQQRVLPTTACWGGGPTIPSAKLLLGGTSLHNLNKIKTDRYIKMRRFSQVVVVYTFNLSTWEAEASLVYRVSFRTVTQRKPVSKN